MVIRFIVGVFKTITLRVIPAMMIIGILWSGYQIAGAVSRQLDERNQYEVVRGQFSSTATVIAQLIPTLTFTPSPTATLTPTSTATLTHTPTATATPTSTFTPTATYTATDAPTATLIPSQTPTTGAMVVAQAIVFATNTPRAVIFATNTPSGQVAPIEEETALPTIPNEEEPTAIIVPTDAPTEVIPTSTPTDLPTQTPQPTVEPTLELLPVATGVSVLPTPLFPQSALEGTVINGVQVPQAVELIPRDYNLVNIILLGTDEALHNSGYALTDTMIIVSINRDTGSVNMLHLPRDLYVYIPTTNGMMQRLNVAYGVGESIGWTGGGFGLLRQTILYNFGINVHYYAKVDFDGFRDIVDLLGGVNIAVDCAYEDYPLIGTELPDGVRRSTEDGLRVLDVGYYEMNGAQALWYARTRRTSSDFDRGRRQQQLLRAIWHKARQSVSLTNAPELWSQGIQIVETDLTLTEVINFGLLPLALSIDFSRIESFSMIPTYHTYSLTVDGANVQAINYETMRQLMLDFYRPPADAQLLQTGATIAVYNGTENHLWDWVATDRLQWEGYLASASGVSDDGVIANTMIIDHTGQQKGSSLNDLVRILNISAENVVIEPNPSRTSDFTVVIGQDYNSCNASGVLPVNR
jgi:LCP family protein required for cell wall assembly